MLIARSAPADWSEVLENSGAEVVRALQDKRLIVRSGDRVNLYWDIFREYVLTKTVPSIPFTYLPASPSLESLLSIAEQLTKEDGRSIAELSSVSGLSEKTVGNVIRDLRMFGVAAGTHSAPRLDPEMQASDAKSILQRIRHVLERHALTLRLSAIEAGKPIYVEDMIDALQEINPAATHRPETWRVYADRMGLWLTATGFIVPDPPDKWIRENQGDITIPKHHTHKRNLGPFTGAAPPSKALEALRWLCTSHPQSTEDIQSSGYRNAISVLMHFSLVCRPQEGQYIPSEKCIRDEDLLAYLWQAAQEESTLQAVVSHLKEKPNESGLTIGTQISAAYNLEWSIASKRRIGNALCQWAKWLLVGENTEKLISPSPIRKPKSLNNYEQGLLFHSDPPPNHQ
jgi:hypothetical protein